MAVEDNSKDQAQEIEFIITPEGEFIFPWWNPLAQEIMDAIGGKLDPNWGSKFCG